MAWIAAAALVAVALAAVIRAWQTARWAAQCRAGAAKIHSELSRMYAGEHDYAVVSPADFPHVERSGYAEVAAALAVRDFRPVGAIEDLTVTAVYPQNRTYVEAHLSADGLLGAATYRVAGRQIVDVISVFEDGRALITTNADIDKLTPPPSVRKEGLPAGAAPAALLSRHRERLAALQSGRIVRSRTLEDVIDQARRHSRLTAEHRLGIGLLTESELMAMVAPGQEATGKRVWEEFLKLTGHDT